MPTQVAGEFEMIHAAYDSRSYSGDGQYGKKVEAILQQQSQARRVLLTTSCTHALETAGILLNFKPGDEVIVPSFTFVSTALAFLMHGAKPVFADIRPDTLNIDEQQLESLITARTRAVVVVHYAGVGCEMDYIQSVCRSHDLTIIEDNAHGLYGRYRGNLLGSFGCLATQSFHETKNFTCGEGGALIINDPALVERAEIIREKGTDRSRFFRGQIDKYSWVDRGSSYVLSDILAAMLYAQLLVFEDIQNSRRSIWLRYRQELEDWANANAVRLPYIPEYCEQAYHMFYLVMPTGPGRDAFIKHLANHDVSAVFHYLPLNLSKFGESLGGKSQPCPVSCDISERLVRLPFYTNMQPQEQSRVIEAVTSFKPADHTQAK